METIYKYQLKVENRQVIEMPAEATPLTIQIQEGNPCLWALVDPSVAIKQERTFLTFGTGHPIASSASLVYIATYQHYQQLNGRLVCHVFEEL